MPQEIENNEQQIQALLDFVRQNIDLDTRQSTKLDLLLRTEPRFLARVIRIKEIFDKNGEENKRYAGVLLEDLKSDIAAMLEVED